MQEAGGVLTMGRSDGAGYCGLLLIAVDDATVVPTVVRYDHTRTLYRLISKEVTVLFSEGFFHGCEVGALGMAP